MLEAEFEILESLVVSLTGKSLLQQGELIRQTYLEKSKSETFIQKLVREGEDHMLDLAREMNDSELEDAAWRMQRLRCVAEKFENILYVQSEMRRDKTRLD